MVKLNINNRDKIKQKRHHPSLTELGTGGPAGNRVAERVRRTTVCGGLRISAALVGEGEGIGRQEVMWIMSGQCQCGGLGLLVSRS